mgnify:CR=1 FL=1
MSKRKTWTGKARGGDQPRHDRDQQRRGRPEGGMPSRSPSREEPRTRAREEIRSRSRDEVWI